MSTTAASSRCLGVFWRGRNPWDWAALHYGHVQPIGYRNHIKHRANRFWQIHLTPFHIERDGSKWELGFCFGKRTLFVRVHH